MLKLSRLFLVFAVIFVAGIAQAQAPMWVDPDSVNYEYQAHIASFWPTPASRGGRNACHMFSYESGRGNFRATQRACNAFCSDQHSYGIVCACYPVRDGYSYPRFCEIRE